MADETKPDTPEQTQPEPPVVAGFMTASGDLAVIPGPDRTESQNRDDQ